MKRFLVSLIVALGLLSVFAAPEAQASHDDSQASQFGYPLNFGPQDIVCDGGYRVQALYGHMSNTPNRYNTGTVRDRMRESLYDSSGILNSEAEIHSKETVGSRVRYVCFNNGLPTIHNIGKISSTSDNWDGIINEVCAKGYTDPSRAYILFLDGHTSNSFVKRNCHDKGIAVIRMTTNFLGQSTISTPTVAHELLHIMGAVNVNAPNRYSYSGGHCRDGRDLMCYGPEATETKCPERVWVDCGGEDYFNPTPVPGSWLAANPHANAGSCEEIFTSCTYTGRGHSPQSTAPTSSGGGSLLGILGF